MGLKGVESGGKLNRGLAGWGTLEGWQEEPRLRQEVRHGTRKER